MKTLLLLGTLFFGASLLPLPAASMEELRAGIEKLTREAQAAKEQGRNDDAHELMAKSKQLEVELRDRQLAEGEGEHKDQTDFKARISRESEARERARKTGDAQELRRKLGHAKELDRRRNDFKHDEGDGRAHHVMEAIKHLRAAGLNEPAEHLERMARQMREGGEPDGHPRGDRRPDGLHAATHELHTAMQEMREQMQKMQHQIQELRAHIAKKAGEERP